MMRERVSDLAVVAISGMTTLDFVSQSPELANVVCLQKPFRPNDLMVAIQAARQAVWQSTAAVVSQKAWPAEPKANAPANRDVICDLRTLALRTLRVKNPWG